MAWCQDGRLCHLCPGRQMSCQHQLITVTMENGETHNYCPYCGYRWIMSALQCWNKNEMDALKDIQGRLWIFDSGSQESS